MVVESMLTISVNTVQSLATWILWLIARGLLLLQFKKLVVRVVLFVYLDFVSEITDVFGRAGSIGSTSWFILAIIVWYSVMFSQMPVWYWLLSSYPLVISLFLVDLMIVARGYIQRTFFSVQRRRAFPTTRIARALTNEPEEIWDLLMIHGVGIGLDALSLVSAWGEIPVVHPWLPHALCANMSLHLVFGAREILQKLGWLRCDDLWTVSALPTHATRPSDPCPMHDVCSICLENLCTYRDEIPAQILEPLRPNCSLAACRHRPSSMSLGLSAVRTKLPDTNIVPDANIVKSSDGARNIATLRCGHSFHDDCMAVAAEASLFCPTCRACLDNGQQPERMEDLEDQMHLVFIGVMSMVTSLGAWALIRTLLGKWSAIWL